MKRLPILILALALLTSTGGFANGPGNLYIQIQVPTNQVILGEPLTCMMTWGNKGESPITIAYVANLLSPIAKLIIQGPIDKDCAIRGLTPEWQVGVHVTIHPQEKSMCFFSPMDSGAVNVGDYEMWIDYDSTAVEPFWDSYGVNRTRVESNHVHFSVVPPQGNDASIFKHYANRCNGITLTSQELLRRFPTSTYAMYALGQFYGLKGYVPPLDVERERTRLAKLQRDGRENLADRTRHLATGPDGKEIKDAKGKPVPITTEEWLRQSVEQAEKVCGAHPELRISEQIRYGVVGYYYLDLLQFQNAAKVFEKLRDSAADPQIKENSGKMLQLLKEAGLIPN